jgi:thioredoxin 1
MALITEVSDATFDEEVLKSQQPVLVDFWASWCGPCRAVAPVVESVAATYEGKLKVMKMNVDQNSQTPAHFGIRGIPALLIFKNGRIAEQIVGFVPKETIDQTVDRVLSWNENWLPVSRAIAWVCLLMLMTRSVSLSWRNGQPSVKLFVFLASVFPSLIHTTEVSWATPERLLRQMLGTRMSTSKRHPEIRRIEPADAAAYRGIVIEALIVHPECFVEDYNTELARPLAEIRGELEQSGTFGAWLGEELIGIATTLTCTPSKRRHCGTVRYLYVKLRFRRKGIGGQLLDEVLHHAAKDVKQLETQVAASCEHALRLLEAHGFRMCGLMPSGLRVGREDVDVWTMIRSLP